MSGPLSPRGAWQATSCSMARALEVVSSKSALLILREAFYGTTRFDDFAERVGISEPVAAARLRELVDEGLLEREPYREPGQRTRMAYRLTGKGAELLPVLVSLMQWGDRWLAPAGPPVVLRHRSAARPCMRSCAVAPGTRPLLTTLSSPSGRGEMTWTGRTSNGTLPGTYTTVMSPAHHKDADDSPVAKAKGVLHRVDRAQQRWPWLAVVVAAVRKFSDDQAGHLAALIAYYAFASIFPLLLVAVTILDIVASHFPKVGGKLLAALHDYPVIGSQLRSSMTHGLSGAGLALIIGILLTLFGARGVATALQNALNSVWEVPQYRRPRFPKNLLRSVGLIAALGPGQIITIALSSVAGGTGHLGGAFAKIAAFVVSLLLNVGLFWVAFRLATAAEVATRELRISAILAAVAWQLLQLLGGFFIAHYSKSTSAYGTFAVVLGLLAWFYLQAQITLYVAEVNVVWVRRLWPRSIAPPPLTAADLAAYQLYAEATLRRPEIDVVVRELQQGKGRRQ